jgi:putative addiction module component (TIGR02574 family)
MSSQTTIPDIHSLSVDQRVELMSVLWDSLISDGWRPPISDEIRSELRRRVEDDIAHPEKAVSWEEVKRAARGVG